MGSGCKSLGLGRPLIPAWVPETTHTPLQGRSLCLKHVFPTRYKCVCLGFSLGTQKAGREFWTLLLARNCVVVLRAAQDLALSLKYSATQHLMRKMKKQKHMCFFFLFFSTIQCHTVYAQPVYIWNTDTLACHTGCKTAQTHWSYQTCCCAVIAWTVTSSLC